MEFFRIMYYLIHSIYLNVFYKNVHINLRARIKPKSKIGKNVKIGKKTWFKGEIGDFSYIGEMCRLNAVIGKFCSISSNVKIVDSTHPTNFISTSPVFYSIQKQCGTTFCKESYFNEMLYFDKRKEQSVYIGNDVWIGENVLLKGGIKIGDGAIIAMGAVVTKDVLPYTIVGGIPAKTIKHRFGEDFEKELVNIKWWNFDEEWIKKNIDIFHINEIQYVIKRLREKENDDQI